MDKCIHIKGVVDGKTITEHEFDKVFNEHNNMVNLWFNSINKYDHGSGMGEPYILTEFKFCPFCGVMF